MLFYEAKNNDKQTRKTSSGVAGERGQMMARASRRRPWGASTYFIHQFKNAFIRRNLDQNMLKNV